MKYNAMKNKFKCPFFIKKSEEISVKDPITNPAAQLP